MANQRRCFSLALFLCVSICICSASVEEETFGTALTEDDSCGVAGDSRKDCSLELLQAKALKESVIVSDESKMEAELNATWRGVRETMHPCYYGHECPSSLGETSCHHFRCICKPGYYYSSLHGHSCVPEPDSIKSRETGGTCYLWGCSKSRGPAKCIRHRCVCEVGYKAQNGVCTEVSDQESFGPSSTTPGPSSSESSDQFSSTSTDSPWGPAPASSDFTSTQEPISQTVAPVLTTEAPPAIPLTTPAVAAAPSVPRPEAACARAPNCAALGLAGYCCPNAAGIRLGCCQ
eukprot:TRINITY_DN1516_c0_g3_i1.p1 TRINITY_DN1516_c0_g3~~TRINITY_DN1516_c0_g3_i1.p1  ORF type:complete len:309 (-),score=28.85 TRINITY_DN1516_c0_g3_i1:85-957(-)